MTSKERPSEQPAEPTAGGIDAEVLKWLQGQGYPLEMLVAKSFRRAGFRVIQSEYYVDPDLKTEREIDLVAWRTKISSEFTARIDMSVECKASSDKPWVLFTSEDTRISRGASVAQRAASRLGHSLLRRFTDREEIRGLPLFDLPERPGYGLTQAFTSGQDVAFAAASSAAKAALHSAVQADSHTRVVPGPVVQVSFSGVVIDGRLFECFLDESENMRVEEVDSGVLLWRNPVVGEPHTIIHISTVRSLDALATAVNETASGLLDYGWADIQVVVTEFIHSAKFLAEKEADRSW